MKRTGMIKNQGYSSPRSRPRPAAGAVSQFLGRASATGLSGLLPEDLDDEALRAALSDA